MKITRTNIVKAVQAAGFTTVDPRKGIWYTCYGFSVEEDETNIYIKPRTSQMSGAGHKVITALAKKGITAKMSVYEIVSIKK